MQSYCSQRREHVSDVNVGDRRVHAVGRAAQHCRLRQLYRLRRRTIHLQKTEMSGERVSDCCAHAHAHARRTSTTADVAGCVFVTPSVSTYGTRSMTSSSSRLVEQSSQQINRHPLATDRRTTLSVALVACRDRRCARSAHRFPRTTNHRHGKASRNRSTSDHQ